MRLLLIFVCILVLLAGCQRDIRECEQPELVLVAERLAFCLGASEDHTVAMMRLGHWGFSGDVITANLLTDTESAEIILTYRGSPQHYDPQGKIAVLQRGDAGWEVVFESPDPTEADPANGSMTLQGNWWFDLDKVGDVQGDGGEDVLFHQRWSNITSYSPSYAKLLTGVNGTVEVLLVEDNLEDQTPRYLFEDGLILSESRFSKGVAMTRTLQLEREAFVVSAEIVNPAAANQYVTLPDGTQYVSFDGACGSLCYHRYGLYRIRGNEQYHFETPIFINVIQQLADGNVYIAGNDLLRVNGDALESPDFALLPENDSVHIVDMAMTSDSEIWAAAQFNLLHYGHEKSEVLALLTHRVYVAEDDSVWALGWDGVADSDCCVFHVVDGEVATFLRGEVSAEIAAMLEIKR